LGFIFICSVSSASSCIEVTLSVNSAANHVFLACANATGRLINLRALDRSARVMRWLHRSRYTIRTDTYR
jgi:hypothetical protein